MYQFGNLMNDLSKESICVINILEYNPVDIYVVK